MVLYRCMPSMSVAFLAAALLIHPPFSSADDLKQNRVSLSGAKQFYVLVEKISPEIEREGLTEGSIAGEVLQQLHRAGLKTIPRAEAYEVPGSPYLYVNAQALKLRATGEYIYAISMAFKQDVYLARDPVMVMGASTWSTGETIGITGNLQKVRASIRAQVEQFIAAYFDANPK